MIDMSFTWRGESSDAYGLKVIKLPPDTGWEQRDEAYPVPGRDGMLHKQDGALEEAQWQLLFYLPYEQGVTVSEIRNIKKWLRGSGALTLSDRPGYRYNAHIIDACPYDAWVQGFADRVGTLYFEVEPYAYRTDSPVDAELTATSGSIPNNGNAICKPAWTIYGSGDLVLTVGTQLCEVRDVVDHITVDSELVMVHKDGTPCYDKASGAFPVLTPGANLYSVTVLSGTFTKLVYSPHWRDY